MNNKQIYITITLVTLFLLAFPMAIMESYIKYGELNLNILLPSFIFVSIITPILVLLVIKVVNKYVKL